MQAVPGALGEPQLSPHLLRHRGGQLARQLHDYLGKQKQGRRELLHAVWRHRKKHYPETFTADSPSV